MFQNILRIGAFTKLDRLDYSILPDAYNADLDAHCVFVYHNSCFTKPWFQTPEYMILNTDMKSKKSVWYRLTYKNEHDYATALWHIASNVVWVVDHSGTSDLGAPMKSEILLLLLLIIIMIKHNNDVYIRIYVVRFSTSRFRCTRRARRPAPGSAMSMYVHMYIYIYIYMYTSIIHHSISYHITTYNLH